MSIANVKVPNTKIAAAFKMLQEKSLFESAVECGLDKYFDTKKDITNYMYKMFLKVKSDPSVFGVQPETVIAVDEAMARRSVGANDKKNQLLADDTFDKIANIKEADIKDIVTVGRNKAAVLLNRKMDTLLKSKKALEKESMVNLAKVFGIYFDKSQIINGQATENIAVLAKGVDDNMTPEEAMAQLIKRREKELESKQ